MKLIRKLGTKENKNGTLISYGEFLCIDCNKIVERQLGNGKRDKSCGCFRIKHNGYNTRLYRIWDDMKTRVLNQNSINYKYYGGRGITVCDEWLEFIPFRDWSLNNGYNEGLTIDRIENNLGYNPENCQWITQKENNRKQSQVKLSLEKANEIRVLYKTGNYTQKELANKFNVNEVTISLIINNKRWENY